jgi:hypothetical protein
MKKIIYDCISILFLFCFSCSSNIPESNDDSYELKRDNNTSIIINSGGCSTSASNINYIIDSDNSTYATYKIYSENNSAFQHILISFPTQNVSKIYIKSTDSSDVENSQAGIFTNSYNAYKKEVRSSTIYTDKYLSFPNEKEFPVNTVCNQIEIYFSNNNAESGIRYINVYEITVYDSELNVI